MNACDYQSQWGSEERNSLLIASTRARGEIAWHQPCETALRELGVTLLVWGERIAEVSMKEIRILSHEGIQLWSISKRYASPVVIWNDLLWYQAEGFFLNAVDKEGKVIHENESFPGALGETKNVQSLYPMKEFFVASVIDLNQKDHDEMTGIDLSSDPEVCIRKNRYGSQTSELVKRFEFTQQTPPLFSPRTLVVSLISGKEIIRTNVSSENDITRLSVPCTELVEWCTVSNDHYCLIGYEADKKVACEITVDGERVWHYLDTSSKDRWVQHPPISGEDGRVYLLTRERLLALSGGRMLWEYVFPLQSERRYACTLSSGTLFATQDATLYHLTADGSVLFSLTLSAPIVGQPTILKSGAIIVATETELVCIV